SPTPYTGPAVACWNGAVLLTQDNPTSVLLGAARAVATDGESAPLSSRAAVAITSMAVLGMGCEARRPTDPGPRRPKT
ncbi:MAG: hypothetical protein WB765_13070, partial [Acidimicrobiales bacterium]